MSATIEYKGYLARVEFDEEAVIFQGDAVNTRAVITFQARSADALQRELAASVEDYLAWCAERGTAPCYCPSRKRKVGGSP